MNELIKQNPEYSASEMRNCTFLMEQYYALYKHLEHTHPGDKRVVGAKRLYEHYQRMVIKIATKPMPENPDVKLIINVGQLEHQFMEYMSDKIPEHKDEDTHG